VSQSPFSQQKSDRIKFGLSVALATPFDEAYKIDIGRALSHAKSCLEGGCSSITLFGTTGEGASIAVEERSAVIDGFIAGGITPSQLVIGVMESAVVAAAVQIEDARRRGCKAILLGCPFYYKNIDDDALFAWFSAVLTQVTTKRRDIILYNIPSVTGVELSISLISRLRTAFEADILGVKDSSGNWDYTQKLLQQHADCVILVGDERHLAHAIRLGGEGAISGMANLCPKRMKTLIDTGQDDEGLSNIVNKLVAHPITSAIKSMLAHIKADEAWARMRPPLSQIEREPFAAMADLVKFL